MSRTGCYLACSKLGLGVDFQRLQASQKEQGLLPINQVLTIPVLGSSHMELEGLGQASDSW